jgi:hypothetical protein
MLIVNMVAKVTHKLYGIRSYAKAQKEVLYQSKITSRKFTMQNKNKPHSFLF